MGYRSTFYWKKHPKYEGETGRIEADYVTFEPGFVVFHQREIRPLLRGETVPPTPEQDHRIILAIHASECYNLREVLNEE